MNQMPVDLIIFDCDGTLVDTEVACATALSELLKGYGLDLDLPTVLREFTGLSFASTVAHVRDCYGVSLPEDFIERMDAAEVAAVSVGTQPIAGVSPQWLRSLGKKMCVATNGSMKKMRASLNCAGLLTVFDPFVFSSEQVAQGKPAPDVFLFAAEQMGALQDRCLVVEDSEAGIRAAMAANMRVLGLVGHLPEDQIIALGAEPIQRMECISATLSS